MTHVHVHVDVPITGKYCTHGFTHTFQWKYKEAYQSVCRFAAPAFGWVCVKYGTSPWHREDVETWMLFLLRVGHRSLSGDRIQPCKRRLHQQNTVHVRYIHLFTIINHCFLQALTYCFNFVDVVEDDGKVQVIPFGHRFAFI